MTLSRFFRRTRSPRPTTSRRPLSTVRPRLERLEDRTLLDSGWVTNMGGVGNEYVNDLAGDAAGNTYVTGVYGSLTSSNPATFGSTTLPSSGGTDMYVAKLNPIGEFQWAVKAGDPLSAVEASYSVTLDATGNVYIAGGFTGTAQFGPHSLTSVGSWDAFVAKLNGSTGQFLWARRLGGAGLDHASAVAVDTGGNVFLGGAYTTPDGRTPFVSKFDTAGTELWTRSVPGTIPAGLNNSGFLSLAVDAAGDVYASGSFVGTATFPTGTLTSSDTAVGIIIAGDLLFTKLAGTDGTWLWARSMDVVSGTVRGAALSSGGPLYVTGNFSDTAQFDSILLTSVGSSDGFVARLDPATGAVDWAHRFGGTGAEVSVGVVVDPQGNVQLAGKFFGPADFGGQTLLTNGRPMGFVTTLDSSGTFLESLPFATVVGSSSGVNVSGLHIDATGNRYVGGHFNSSATAEFPQRTVTNPSTASEINKTSEAFVVKLPPYGPPQKLFSLANDGSVDGSVDGIVPGVQVANEDIISFDGNAFRRYFDGSDVGLAGLAIDAFEIISPTEILLSFSSSGSVPGLGTVAPEDIVKFTAAQLYDHTVGTFSMYFDGSDVGLSGSAENVDAIERLSDGRLLISTAGNVSVSGASGGAEDILAFTPTSLGSNTAGSWAMYFDGSDVGLSGSAENVTAIAVDASGKLYLTTSGNFNVPGASGANEDVFVFTPTSLGSNTAGTYSPSLFFDGSQYGLSGNALTGLSLPLESMIQMQSALDAAFAEMALFEASEGKSQAKR